MAFLAIAADNRILQAPRIYMSETSINYMIAVNTGHPQTIFGKMETATLRQANARLLKHKVELLTFD
jgi:hypothetical protein